jgi:hypothetical protein
MVSGEAVGVIGWTLASIGAAMLVAVWLPAGGSGEGDTGRLVPRWPHARRRGVGRADPVVLGPAPVWDDGDVGGRIDVLLVVGGALALVILLLTAVGGWRS